MDIASFKARLEEFDALRDSDEVVTDTVERLEARFAQAWPTRLRFKVSSSSSERRRSVQEILSAQGITRLYQHQADAINRSLDGADVVLEAPTASGKTVAFTAPIRHSLVRNPGHALMIYPMKALAFDQLAEIKRLCDPLSVNTYDGDTPSSLRKFIRERPPHILLTNPEYLNMSFLGWRDQWKGFLSNLRYLVIDEMHEYRGFFGGNMALLLRRFFLHLSRIGATPQVFLCTATCANPAEHAQNLTGRKAEVVSARQALRPRRHFMFVKPDIPDYRYRGILQLRVEQAALAAMAEGFQTLIFCPTKRFLEEAFGECRRKAKDRQLDPEAVSAFHADLKKDDRQSIQQRIKSGDLQVVFATNALELGLDIGGLDIVILAGFPPSVMSAWQQIGRAGRGWDKDAFVLFYAMNDPIDRFFVGNMRAFLTKPFDEIVVDPENEKLIDNHLAMLACETDGELDPSDEKLLGRAFYDAARSQAKPPKYYRPHKDLNLRGDLGQRFQLRIRDDEVGHISGIRKFREAYIGAIFTFFGRRYIVRSHEESAVVLAADAKPYLRTEGKFFTVVYIDKILDGISFGDFEIYYGSVNVVTTFSGYRQIDSRTDEVVGSDGAAAAEYQNNLHALWMNVPQCAKANGAIGALEHLMRVGAMFVIPADRFDTSTYSRMGGEPMTFYYENYSGGIGIAKKLFEVWETALAKGIEIAENCKCGKGCQICIEPAKSYDISNSDIDKIRGVELAKQLLAEAATSARRRFRNGRMVAVDEGLVACKRPVESSGQVIDRTMGEPYTATQLLEHLDEVVLSEDMITAIDAVVKERELDQPGVVDMEGGPCS